MKRTLTAMLGGATAALALAASASAQPYPYGAPYGQPQQPWGGDRSGPSITLYEGENFTGRAVTVFGFEGDFTRIGFNDRARSARAQGRFVLCEDIQFRGRCEQISGSVRSLEYLGLNGRVSSARVDDGRGPGYGDGPGYGGRPPYGGGYDRDDDGDRPGRGDGYGAPRRDGVQGRTVIFFARPMVSGNDVAARGQASADQFCRASGYGSAVYFAAGERSRRAVDQDGRIVDAPALRDVLCRTR